MIAILVYMLSPLMLGSWIIGYLILQKYSPLLVFVLNGAVAFAWAAFVMATSSTAPPVLPILYLIASIIDTGIIVGIGTMIKNTIKREEAEAARVAEESSKNEE